MSYIKPYLNSVKDYGAKGDGINDDTASINTAINNTFGGGSLFLPRGLYKTSSVIIINKAIHIYGEGSDAYYYGNFGDSFYTNTPYLGSVIQCIATTGCAILHAPTGGFATIRLSDFAIVGNGNNSRTTTGIRIGAGLASSIACFPSINNIRISNFRTGMDLYFVENSTLNDIAIYGCNTGLQCNDATNANTFTNIDFTGCGDSINLLGASKNVWIGGAIQASSGNGVRIIHASEENSFRDVYFESNIGTGYAILTSGDCTIIDSCHFGGTAANVKIGAGSCRIFNVKYAQNLEIAPIAQSTTIIGNWSGNVSDSGLYTMFINQTSNSGSPFGITTGAPIKFTSNSLINPLENGSLEYDGSHFYGTIGSTRARLDNTQSSTTGQLSGLVNGSVSGLFVNSATTGGVGGSAYTFGDIVKAMKLSGLLSN